MKLKLPLHSLAWSVFVVVVVLSANGAVADEKFTRPAMVEAIARNWIRPGLEQLHAASTNLTIAALTLRDAPGTNTLARAQRAWVDMSFAWKRVQVLQHGPVKDRTFWAATFFKQAYSTAVENVVRSSKPLDDEFIEILGSSAKGFFVIEYLLFDLPTGDAGKVGVAEARSTPRLSAQHILDGSTAPRRRAYLLALVQDLERRLAATVKDAQAKDFPAKFASGGQDSINLLVNQLTEGVETGLVMYLRTYLDQFADHTLRFDQLEGSASGTSLACMIARAQGLRDFYRGANGLGIDDYARHVTPGLHERIEEQFTKTITALEAVGQPFEQSLASKREAIEGAFEESKTLELLCKVDLVSALGITIMFSANDGD